jgi:arginine and glutamate-rich protein 1
MNEVERLAEMERQRRQREVEARMVEEESAARIEALVQQRVQEELERRKVRRPHYFKFLMTL